MMTAIAPTCTVVAPSSAMITWPVMIPPTWGDQANREIELIQLRQKHQGDQGPRVRLEEGRHHTICHPLPQVLRSQRNLLGNGQPLPIRFTVEADDLARRAKCVGLLRDVQRASDWRPVTRQVRPSQAPRLRRN